MLTATLLATAATGKPGLLSPPVPVAPGSGAVATGQYRNLFTEIGFAADEVQTKLDKHVNQLLGGGDAATESVLFDAGDGTAYILSPDSGDVRTEGMSYGMTIAVQRGNVTLFRALWSWAKRHMRHNDPADPRFGYFAWHCTPQGKQLDPNPATDGETYFVTALYMAAARWNTSAYAAEADTILLCGTNKTGREQSVTRMFVNDTGVAGAEAQPVFVPYARSATFTDPSYHLPSFYELWHRSGPVALAPLFRAMANSSRYYFRLGSRSSAAGLMADYSKFDGTPTGSGINGVFAFDAWRVAMNVATDYAWFASDQWQITYCNGLLRFFAAQNASAGATEKGYGNQYQLPSLRPLSQDHSPGLVAMNAVCALASTEAVAWDFVRELWHTPTPTGKYRYYDGMLFLLGWLHVSGNFRYYGGGLEPPSPSPPPPPRPPPPPKPSPPPPPSPPGSVVKFERNGRCLTAGPVGDPATLGGCYVRNGSNNLWAAPEAAGASVRAAGAGLEVSAPCAAGAMPVMTAAGVTGPGSGRLSWGGGASGIGQLILAGCSPALCAGDAGALKIIDCGDSRASHWKEQPKLGESSTLRLTLKTI